MESSEVSILDTRRITSSKGEKRRGINREARRYEKTEYNWQNNLSS
jgi:hypothetical protein